MLSWEICSLECGRFQGARKFNGDEVGGERVVADGRGAGARDKRRNDAVDLLFKTQGAEDAEEKESARRPCYVFREPSASEHLRSCPRRIERIKRNCFK